MLEDCQIPRAEDFHLEAGGWAGWQSDGVTGGLHPYLFGSFLAREVGVLHLAVCFVPLNFLVAALPVELLALAGRGLWGEF